MSDVSLGITITSNAGQAKAEVTSLTGTLSKLSEQGDKTSKSLSQHMSTLGRQFGAIAGLYAGKEMFSGVVQATAQMDRLRGMMDAASGSAALSSDNLAFVAQSARHLGVNLTAAAEGFASLTAATQGTALQGQATRDIFEAVSTAAAALGKSSADTQGILLALSQMVSKGTVSMEELRGQLGERLPGAMRLAAASMGRTTQELDKLVSSGQITAAELLPKLAKALDDTYSGARFDRINNQLTRLDNAWLQIKANLMDSDTLAGMVGRLATALDGLTATTTPLERTRTRIADLRSEIAALEKQMAQPWWTRPVDISLTGADQLATLRKQLSGEQNRLGGLTALAGQSAAATALPTIKNAYVEAASAVWKLSEAQKTVASQIVTIAEAKGFDPAWLLSIAKAETQLGALANTSSKGAKGVFQFMDAAAARFGVKDPLNIEQAANGAIQYLTLLQKQFDSTQLATAAYNAGEGSVSRYGNVVPPYKETQDYTAKVKTGLDALNAAMGRQTEGWTTLKTATNEAAVAFRRMGEQEALSLQAAEQRKALTLGEIERRKLLLGVDEQIYKAQLAAQLELTEDADRKAALLGQAQTQESAWRAQSLDLIRQQADAEAGLVQAQLDSLQRTIAGAEQQQQSVDTINGLKLKALELENQLVLLAQQRSNAELSAASQIGDYTERANAMKQQELKTLQDLSTELQWQQTLYDKLSAAKAAGANTDQLQLLAATMEKTRSLEGSVSDAQIAKVQELTTATEALKQKNDELAGSSQSVREEQLRANQAWEESLQRMQDYMAGLGDSMGETGKAFAKVAVSMGRYEKQQKQIWRDLAQANKDNPQEESLNTAHAYLEVGMSSLTMMADMADAAKTMYEEGSSGYQSMADAAFAMRSAVMALNIVDGIAAILKQLKEGDPYSAIPRAIAVAGMVAALGVSVAAHAGTGNTQGYAEKAGKNDTGTVFGDSSAQSESLTNALKLVAANSTADLSYSAGMLRSLQNIEYAMAGATRSVLMNVKPSSFSQPGPVAGNGMIAFGMDPFSIALTNMLMKRTREVTDYGLASNPQALGDVLSGGYQGKIYTDIKTQTKLLGMTISESMKTVFKALDDATANDFTRIIVNLKDTLVEAGRALGASADDFTSRMAGFTVDLGAQSLKGLKGEELQKQLQAMFSALSDRMAQAFMPGLDDFQKVGEGYFETMVRVSHGINTASGMLAQLGLEATKYTDIVWKQGDVAAEIVRQSIVQAEGAATAIGRYMDTAVGSADDLIAVYQDLLAIKDMAPTLAFNLDALTQTMVVTAGGVSRLKEAMASYLTGFFSQSEQMGVTYAALQRQFGSLGTTVPGSRKAFRDLVSGLDLTTESGQKLYARLMALADPLASFMDQLDQARQAFLEGFGTPTDQIQAQYKALKAEFNALGKAVPVSREAFRDLVNGITGTTEAGRLLRGQLMSLSAGLAEYFSRIEQIQARYAPLTNPFAELETNLKTVNDDFALLLQSTQDGQTQSRKQIDKLSRQIQGNLTKIDDLETALAKEEAKRKPNQTRLDRIRDSLIDRQTAILAWQAEIDRLTAQSANEIDSVLEEQGLALVAALKSGWESIVGSLNAARDSVASQLADLNGPQAKLDLSITREAEAQARLALAGANPAEVAKLVGGVQEAIMARYNAELALINETATKAQQAYNTQLQAIKQIKDYAKGLLLSGNSTLSPEARLTTARGQYEALLQQSQTGNADALGQLTSAADAYLQAAQGYFASGPEYQTLFGQIYEALDTLGSTTLIDPVDTQTAAIEALKAETVAKLTDLQAVTAAAMTSAQDQMGTFIKDFESWMVANHVDSVALLDAVSGLRQTVFGTSAEGIRIPDPTIDALMPNDMGPIPITFTPPNAPLAVQTTGSPLSTSDAEVTSLLTSIQQEAKAQVAVQTAAFPSMIERLAAVEATLSRLERTARLAA